MNDHRVGRLKRITIMIDEADLDELRRDPKIRDVDVESMTDGPAYCRACLLVGEDLLSPCSEN